jgi:hypothetical protein
MLSTLKGLTEGFQFSQVKLRTEHTLKDSSSTRLSNKVSLLIDGKIAGLANESSGLPLTT